MQASSARPWPTIGIAIAERNRMATRKKSSTKRYSKKANTKIARVMREAKRGKLRSGGSGKKVKSRKQAVAIALSEARREGDKVPPNPSGKSSGSRKKAASGGRKKASSGGRKKASSASRSTRSTKRRGSTTRGSTTRGSTTRGKTSRRSTRS